MATEAVHPNVLVRSVRSGTKHPVGTGPAGVCIFFARRACKRSRRSAMDHGVSRWPPPSWRRSWYGVGPGLHALGTGLHGFVRSPYLRTKSFGGVRPSPQKAAVRARVLRVAVVVAKSWGPTRTNRSGRRANRCKPVQAGTNLVQICTCRVQSVREQRCRGVFCVQTECRNFLCNGWGHAVDGLEARGAHGPFAG